MSSERIYREPSIFTRSELVAELNSGDPRRMAGALTSAVRHDDDWQCGVRRAAFVHRLAAPLGLSRLFEFRQAYPASN
jgi:hypothetical protein